jgi:hypothetical protein
MAKNRKGKHRRDLWKGLTAPWNEQDLQYLRDNPNPNYKKQWEGADDEPAGQEGPGEDEEMAETPSGSNGVDNANADEVSCGFHCPDKRRSLTID